jgi:hypothetical protein
VGVGVGVDVSVGVGGTVGDAVSVGGAVGVSDSVEVGVSVGVDVGDAEGDNVTVSDGVSVSVGVNVAVLSGVSAGAAIPSEKVSGSNVGKGVAFAAGPAPPWLSLTAARGDGRAVGSSRKYGGGSGLRWSTMMPVSVAPSTSETASTLDNTDRTKPPASM